VSLSARNELDCRVSGLYQKADKLLKRQILAESCLARGYSRKYGLRILRSKEEKRRTRCCPRIHEDQEVFAISRLWPIACYLGSRPLAVAQPSLIEALDPHREWIPESAVLEQAGVNEPLRVPSFVRRFDPSPSRSRFHRPSRARFTKRRSRLERKPSGKQID
jgi:hypothetical protein